MALRVSFDDSQELNMTPMIDIVFNLLIFFLLSSTYLKDQQEQSQEVEIQLPKVQSAAPLTEAPQEITVTVLADGRFAIGRQEYTLEGLKLFLQKAVENFPDQAVAVRGDATVAYQKVAQVIALCKQVGVAQLDVLVIEEP